MEWVCSPRATDGWFDMGAAISPSRNVRMVMSDPTRGRQELVHDYSLVRPIHAGRV